MHFQNFMLFSSGACKVVNMARDGPHRVIKGSEFHSPPPSGYILKTSVEIMFRMNIHNFEMRRNEETIRPVTVDNKWKAIQISMFLSDRYNNLRILRVGN